MFSHTDIPTVPAKLPRLAVYLTPELKKDLEKLASRQQRSLSNLAAYLLQKAVDEAKASGEIQ